MIDIKQLELTDEDFKLLIDGLDALPNKDAAGDIFEVLMIGLIGKDDPAGKQKAEDERQERKRKSDQEKQQKIEDIKILQGKLLILKRYFMQEGALKQANDILYPKQ